MRRVKFYTLGCKVNQYETQIAREQFQRARFQESEDSVPADVCVINTCTVTQRADCSSLGLMRRALRENPDSQIIVTGCLTEFDSQKILKENPECLIIKNKDKFNILSFLKHRLSKNNRYNRAQGMSISYFKNHSRAFLKVQDGCNYRCSYCKVRLVRGKSRSQALPKVKREAAALIKNGYLEIVLSGICLGSYGRDLLPKSSLAELIKELEAIKGHFRIRLSSIEPNDISNELIQLIAKSNRLCRHLHIPMQSGDKQILKQMKRTYSPDGYMALIQRIRRYMPEIAVTTDVIVGFPGETEMNFENTIKLIQAVKPSRVHIFPFSKRINTPACDSGGFVSEGKIKSRIAVLERVVWDLRSAYYQRFISRPVKVLIERAVDGYPGLWEGYSGNYIKVRVKSRIKLNNRFIRVRLREARRDFMLADIIKK